MSTKLVTSASVSKSESSKSIMDPQVNGVQGPVKSDADKSVLLVIDSLKKKVAEDRCAFVKEKIEQSRQKMIGITNNIFSFSNMRRHSTKHEADNNVNLLSKRMQDALCMLNGSDISYGKKYLDDQQDSHAPVVLLGSNFGATNAIRPIKLPEVAKLPPYTTWIFLDRNQRMTDDQSVVGRRRIYYDQNGGEALICSDSEEEIVEDEEEKKEFRNAEDFIIRMTIEEAGLSDAVLDSLGECFSRKPCEIKARYESLKGEIPQCSKMEDTKDEPKLEELFADKNLEAAQDSLDNLFCRRCLVFDCRLHGCSQDLVFPAEKQRPWSPPDAEKVPCDRQCYLLTLKAESIATGSCSMMPDEENPMPSFRTGGQKSHRRRTVGSSCGKRTKSNKSESASSNARNISESSESEIRPHQDKVSTQKSSRTSPVKAKLASKGIIRNRLLLSTQQASDRALRCMQKRQKKLVTSDSDSVVSGAIWTREMKLRSNSRKENGDASSSSQMKVKSPRLSMSRKESSVKNNNKLVPVEGDDESSDEVDNDDNLGKDEFVGENIYRNEGDKSWKPIEKSLFLKGLEIFGKNSCLIARNLLCDMKTCTDIFQYMNFTENKQSYGADDGADSEGQSKVDYNDALGGKLRTRSRFIRRRGKVRRLKYTWKSAGYNSIRKRITDKKDQPYRQYNPCGCQSACGKQCPCHLNGTCCEKYCGCPKSCKNRFRGCHCAKSQCRSRQCPCFAAGRECDSDVCRNCWVGCGDGAFGGPSQSGDNYECRNMKLLLKQQQRVLLGRSDVSGWGAFLKNSVSKHEYLGEYTGELISHREADKRGKIYDRENSSFLFNLNDKFVLDAYRRGDKLKFANHSPNPNCYAKVIMVGGDHRVGIFANERINAGEELFYDYRYEPDRAPAWAKKSDAPGLKKDEVGPSNGRAKKCPKG